jgi:hypothetical protein
MNEKLMSIQEGDQVQPVDRTTLKRIFNQWKIDNDLRALSPSEMEKRVEVTYGKYMRGGWTSFKIDG